MESHLEFLPRPEIHLREIYKEVRGRHPDLCDDGYLCSTCCKDGTNNPEWHHVVRTVLNNMKKVGLAASGSSRGVWLFGAATSATEARSEYEALEGRRLLRLHKLKERKPQLVRRKKRATLQATGRLLCEACGFDFAAVYGELGAGFAECHHTQPLGEAGERVTTLGDLAVVCANCHRMLHRRPWRTVGELRELLRSRRTGKYPEQLA
jgi:predicted HNH restriction endonuclease